MADPNELLDPEDRDDVWQCHRHPGRYMTEDEDCDTCEDE